MGLTIRRVAPSESRDYVRTMFWAAGRAVDEAFIQDRLSTFEIDRSLAAFDGSSLIGTVGTRTLSMSLPGGRRVATAGVGQGGVLPSQRGRGAMRALMIQAQGEAMDRGDVLAAGTTSEWPIYERYGWGPASYCASYLVRNLARGRPRKALGRLGRCELITAAELLPEIVDLHRRATAGPGGVARDATYWAQTLDRLERGASLDVLDPDSTGPRALFCCTRDEMGSVDGVAAFRIYQCWHNGLFDSRLSVEVLIAATTNALEELWHFLLGFSTVERLTLGHRPIDDPLRFMLHDGRRLETTGTQDHLWMRVLDPITALKARRLGSMTAPLRLKLHDPVGQVPKATLKIMSDGTESQVAVTSEEPQVEMGLAAFSSLFLGGNSVRSLAMAERISAASDDALLELARALSTDQVPFADTSF